jgi:hypothetical protein
MSLRIANIHGACQRDAEVKRSARQQRRVTSWDETAPPPIGTAAEPF